LAIKGTRSFYLNTKPLEYTTGVDEGFEYLELRHGGGMAFGFATLFGNKVDVSAAGVGAEDFRFFAGFDSNKYAIHTTPLNCIKN